MQLKHTLTGILCAAAALMMTGCNQNTNTKTAKLVYANWAEGVAYTHLAQAVLEEKMGYEVELMAADVAPAYISVAQGSQDAFMECWRGLHKDYLDRFEGKLLPLGSVNKSGVVGLAVPTYVTIDTIAELQTNADKFGGKITGVDAGAGMMRKIEKELIPLYGLSNIKLMASSGPAMTAALSDAIKHKEWIVVAAWKPHWMFGRWDLKFLKQDEDKTIWESSDLEIIGRIDLVEDKPELAQFLKNFKLSDDQLANLLLKVNDSDAEITDVVHQWILDNEEVVASWIPKAL